MKTNKSYTKRIRVTRNGKLMVRVKGQNHFNAKSSGSQRSAKRRSVSINLTAKVRARFLPGSGAK
ncbi:50S ribosomal protein L35 [Candidatus Kaiserbacteria bacterium]|nr:50S ribosomal protein L35 [Candidatus Kaiserbacteria bacterium]